MSKVFHTVAVREDVTLVHASRGNEMAPLLPPPIACVTLCFVDRCIFVMG